MTVGISPAVAGWLTDDVMQRAPRNEAATPRHDYVSEDAGAR